MEFNKLYGVSSSGKVKEWQIFVLDKKTEAHVVIKHGYIDGKKIENIQVITKGKNLGRLNETTVLQQAISEAKSKWNKKKDSGYTEKIKDTKVPTEIPLPMLALNYTKRSGDILFLLPIALTPSNFGWT